MPDEAGHLGQHHEDAAERHPGGGADDAEPVVQQQDQPEDAGVVGEVDGGRRTEDVVCAQCGAEVPGEAERQHRQRGQPRAGDRQGRVGESGRDEVHQDRRAGRHRRRRDHEYPEDARCARGHQVAVVVENSASIRSKVTVAKR